MQIFLFLNDLAGRYALLDECARFFYVGAVPLLSALFLGELLLLSPQDNAAKARRALAVLLALLLLTAIGTGIEALSRAWHLGTLSPRPFMTRRINLLVVEPQDNSFPCYEVAVAAILAVAMAFSSRKWGIAGAVLTVLLALDRLFCGTNFLADVAFGALLGASIGAMFCAFCTAPQPFERAAMRQWASATALVVFSLGASYVSFAQTPRFAAKLPLLWSSVAAARSAPADARGATRAAPPTIGEGEGLSEAPAAETAPTESTTVETAPRAGAQSAATLSNLSVAGAAKNAANSLPGAAENTGEESANAAGEPSAEALALSKRASLFLPAIEKFLRGRLAPRAAPFRLLDVEVAPVRAGKSSYRCAALRFEITRRTPDLRRRTAQIAAALVKLAFASDSQLQNVDVTAILRGDGAQIDGTSLRFAGDEVPVFTASILRQNLRLAAPRWANDPKLDGGLWLRTRSRLYINEKILPVLTQSSPEFPAPAATSIAPKMSAPQPLATPVSAPQPATAAPQPAVPIPSVPMSRPAPTSRPKPAAKHTAKPATKTAAPAIAMPKPPSKTAAQAAKTPAQSRHFLPRHRPRKPGFRRSLN